VSSDARFERATELAAVIQAKADELSTAIYQAHRDGYRVSLCVANAVAVDVGDRDARFIGNGEAPVAVRATVAFDIGRAVL
jgi:hypothetical protein